jgi:hypothetical protein
MLARQIIKIIKKDKWHILSKDSNLKGTTCTIFLFTKFYIFLLGGTFKLWNTGTEVMVRTSISILVFIEVVSWYTWQCYRSKG